MHSEDLSSDLPTQHVKPLDVLLVPTYGNLGGSAILERLQRIPDSQGLFKILCRHSNFADHSRQRSYVMLYSLRCQHSSHTTIKSIHLSSTHNATREKNKLTWPRTLTRHEMYERQCHQFCLCHPRHPHAAECYFHGMERPLCPDKFTCSGYLRHVRVHGPGLPPR